MVNFKLFSPPLLTSPETTNGVALTEAEIRNIWEVIRETGEAVQNVHDIRNKQYPHRNRQYPHADPTAREVATLAGSALSTVTAGAEALSPVSDGHNIIDQTYKNMGLIKPAEEANLTYVGGSFTADDENKMVEAARKSVEHAYSSGQPTVPSGGSHA